MINFNLLIDKIKSKFFKSIYRIKNVNFIQRDVLYTYDISKYEFINPYWRHIKCYNYTKDTQYKY